MYDYNKQKSEIFKPENQTTFLKVRDYVGELLNNSGAFKMSSTFKNQTGDVWTMIAYIDRLVEIGEIREIPQNNVAGQDRIFVRN